MFVPFSTHTECPLEEFNETITDVICECKIWSYFLDSIWKQNININFDWIQDTI